MTRSLTDKDGIDGPFERQIAVKPAKRMGSVTRLPSRRKPEPSVPVATIITAIRSQANERFAALPRSLACGGPAHRDLCTTATHAEMLALAGVASSMCRTFEFGTPESKALAALREELFKACDWITGGVW